MVRETSLVSNTKKSYRLEPALLGIASLIGLGALAWNLFKPDEIYLRPRQEDMVIQSQEMFENAQEHVQASIYDLFNIGEDVPDKEKTVLYVNDRILSRGKGIKESYPFIHDTIIYNPTVKDPKRFSETSGEIDLDSLENTLLGSGEFNVYLGISFYDTISSEKKIIDSVSGQLDLIKGIFFFTGSDDKEQYKQRFSQLCNYSKEKDVQVYFVTDVKENRDILLYAEEMRTKGVLLDQCLTTIYKSCKNISAF
jgi:hypothetical protein